jgi:glutamine amidotransferase PdxT
MADSSFVQPRPGMDGNNGIFDVDVEEIDDLNDIDNLMINGGESTPRRSDGKYMGKMVDNLNAAS